MDPDATLMAVAQCLSHSEYQEAAELLDEYWNWRHRGGFEPCNGDTRARALASRIEREAR